MSVNANEIKGKFAALKYEQLLSDKYFIETCFSKKFESKPSKEKLDDMVFDIKLLCSKERPTSFSLNVNENCDN